MTVGRLRELLGSLAVTQEVIVWDADNEERRIVAVRLPADGGSAAQLLTEEYSG